jgi:galactokinase
MIYNFRRTLNEGVVDVTVARRLAGEIRSGGYDAILKELYLPDAPSLEALRARYADAIGAFEKIYGGEREVALYSVPGRVEICGNHTDHNGGAVLAAAVNLDIVAVVSRSDDNVVRVRSEGFDGEDAVRLSELSPDEKEFGKSSAMIRGVAAGLAKRDGHIGGFDAYTVSDVLKGSGLSSSAAFEVCIGAIFNGEYNGGRFGPIELGIVGQHAENVYFGKPSGLMDQISCAAGGAISIDLKNPAEPVVTKVQFDLSAYGLKLVVTDTGGDHAALTGEYSAIRDEMERAARFFGRQNLREVDRGDFFGHVSNLRDSVGDRAVLRAIHFFEECDRVGKSIDAIRKGHISRFLKLIVDSGNSSFEYNQNAYCIKEPDRQGVPLALALSQVVLGEEGAWRLQGGGFAGTIQAFVPDHLLDRYCSVMRGVFGDACRVLRVRDRGALNVAKPSIGEIK